MEEKLLEIINLVNAKDYTYKSSVKNALTSSIELLNLITKLNYKLFIHIRHIL